MMPLKSEKYTTVLFNLKQARKEMGDIKKDSVNPFHKSKYASLAVYIEAVDEPLDRWGMILVQHIGGDYDKPLLITELTHIESGEWIRSYVQLPNPKQDCQGLGAAITYLRRYSMSALLGLHPENDCDAANNCLPREDKKQNKPLQNQQNPQNQQNELQKKPPQNQPTQSNQNQHKNPPIENVQPPKKPEEIIKHPKYNEFIKKHNIVFGQPIFEFVTESIDKCKTDKVSLLNRAVINESQFIVAFDKWHAQKQRMQQYAQK